MPAFRDRVEIANWDMRLGRHLAGYLFDDSAIEMVNLHGKGSERSEFRYAEFQHHADG